MSEINHKNWRHLHKSFFFEMMATIKKKLEKCISLSLSLFLLYYYFFLIQNIHSLQKEMLNTNKMRQKMAKKDTINCCCCATTNELYVSLRRTNADVYFFFLFLFLKRKRIIMLMWSDKFLLRINSIFVCQSWMRRKKGQRLFI